MHLSNTYTQTTNPARQLTVTMMLTMIRTIWEIVLKTVRHPILLLPLLQCYTRLHFARLRTTKPPSNSPINVQLLGGSYDHNYDVIIAVVSELDSPESRVWFRDNLQGASHVAGDELYLCFANALRMREGVELYTQASEAFIPCFLTASGKACNDWTSLVVDKFFLLNLCAIKVCVKGFPSVTVASHSWHNVMWDNGSRCVTNQLLARKLSQSKWKSLTVWLHKINLLTHDRCECSLISWPSLLTRPSSFPDLPCWPSSFPDLPCLQYLIA